MKTLKAARKTLLWALAAVLLLAMLPMPKARAAVLNVTSMEELFEAVATVRNGDVIYIKAEQDLVFDRAVEISKSITISGAANSVGGYPVLVLEAGAQFRHFYSDASVDLTFKNLTLDGGGTGGGIALTGQNSRVEIADCLIRSCAAVNGGGMYVNGSVTITDSDISGNTATGMGGGVSASVITAGNSVIEGNTAGAGGGLRAGSAVIKNCIISDNMATVGAGGGTWIDFPAITGVTFSGNSAATEGGGLRSSVAEIMNSTVIGNSAGLGGGIYAYDSAVIINSTITANTANEGGGLWLMSGEIFGDIVAGNTASAGMDAFIGNSEKTGNGSVDSNYNIIGVSDMELGAILSLDANGPVLEDGRYVPLAVGSAAVDKIPYSVWAAWPGAPAESQNGIMRGSVGNVDIGSVEMGLVISAPNSGDDDVIEDPDVPLALPFPFADVNKDEWFYASAEYVWSKGLILGTSNSEFSPQMTMTRGMIATVLYRSASMPDGKGFEGRFGDVSADAYYAEPISWAVKSRIVLGVGDGRFEPESPISRQDLAVILMRYASSRGAAFTATRPYTSFADEAQFADYAVSAIETLYKAGVLNGNPDNTFNPAGHATRAEVATILHRFLKIV